MADFTGFYLGGIHSSTYGILRVSDGDRYSEGLIPEFDNMELELSGGNGDLYGGKKFKKTSFEIKIAFEHLTEKQFREMRNWLGKTELQSFRFDERPYKTYWVTLASRPELEYVCFMEEREDGLIGEKERIYKGEGELEFIAYSPFGYCINEQFKSDGVKIELDPSATNWQSLSSYNTLTLKDNNLLEWIESSGLRQISDSTFYSFSNGQYKENKWQYYINLYNPGDFDTDFQLSFHFSDNNDYDASQLNVYVYIYPNTQEEPEVGDSCFSFKLVEFKGKTNTDTDTVMLLDTKKHSLSYYDEENISLRYDLIDSAIWPKIPKGEWKMKIETAANGGKFSPKYIKYDYRYY